MSRENALQQLKTMIEPYLQARGIDTRHNFKCLNPEHNEDNPSMGLDRANNQAHCFACGARYDIVDLIKMDNPGLDDKAAFETGYRMFNIDAGGLKASPPAEKPANKKPEQDYTEYCRKAHEQIDKTDYPSTRGLTKGIVNRFNLGYDEHFKAGYDKDGNPIYWQALIIPTSPFSYVARNINATTTDKENKVRKSPGEARLFNLQALDADGPIFIVEGEIDAMSIAAAGLDAIGLGGISNLNKLLKALESRKPKQPLILALDKDERGRQAEKDLAKALGDKGIPYIQADIYGAYNDANEMYTKDLAGFASALSTTISGLKAAQDEAKQAAKAEYMSNTAAAHMQGFDEYIKARTNRKPLTTGFSQLDGYMGGGIYEGLYFIGGITSSGKTALGMQIADNLAEQGQDVIIFSLEMSRYELMARSISRLTFKNCRGIDTSNAKAARAILDGAFNSDAERQLYQVARAQYLDFNEHIHIHEGVGDIGVNHIRQTVERHISFTNTRPVILVDYLQILAPYNERYTDKQNTDKAVTELKRISRDCQIPVIAISSLNRENYKNEVGYTAFKESGAIEYSCDVLLGLQYKNITTPGFNEDAEAKKNPRTMQVKILKQRLAPKGNTVDFNYFAFANYFAEIKMPGR